MGRSLMLRACESAATTPCSARAAQRLSFERRRSLPGKGGGAQRPDADHVLLCSRHSPDAAGTLHGASYGAQRPQEQSVHI